MSNSNERFPGSNPEAPHGIEQRILDQNVVCEQITTRARVLMGLDQLSDLSYGIIASSDPSTPASGDPFLVSQNSGNSLRFDLSLGRAMAQSGFLIELLSDLEALELAGYTTGAKNVVFLSYQTQETTDPAKQAVTRAGTIAGVEFEVVADTVLVQVDTLDRYIDSSIYTDDAKQHHVALAVITIVEDDLGVKSLSIDQSRSTYAWNRPWFSAVDYRHRNRVGSAQTSDNNPHGLGLSDIAQGNMTFLQALMRVGTVISKDYDVDRVPGFLCREVIDAARRNVDVTGNLTGIPNAVYVYLDDIPVHLGRCRDLTDQAPPNFFDYAPWLVHGTNLLVFHPDEEIGAEDMEVWYTCAGGSLKTLQNQDILTVSQLDDTREWCITEGQAVTSYASTTVDLREYRPFPYVLRVFARSDGSLTTLPQVVQCNKLIREVNAAQSLDVTLLGPSRIVVGLTNSVSPPAATLDVQIQVTGTDENGALISETLTFDQNWRDYQPPNVQGAMIGEESDTNTYMKRVTTQIFADVTSWNLLANTDSSISASIGIFAHPDWRRSPNLRDLACLGAVLWNGLVVDSIKDYRQVRMGLLDDAERTTVMEASGRIGLRNGIAGTRRTIPDDPVAVNPADSELIVEDFNRPRYHALMGQRFGYYEQLQDPASGGSFDVLDNYSPLADRWADGIGLLSFDYPSPGDAPPQYVSRALRAPIQGHVGAGPEYTGYLKIRLVRNYMEIVGQPGTADNWIANGSWKRIQVWIRIGTNLIANDGWSAWYTFLVSADITGRDIDTFWIQTGDPTTERFSKVQFAVLGGPVRALALEFEEPDEEELNAFEELVFEVAGKYQDLLDREGGGGFLSSTVIKASNRIAVPFIGAMVNDSGLGFEVEDAAQTLSFSGVYRMSFTFDGEALPPERYQVSVQPNTPWGNDENIPVPLACSVQRGNWQYNGIVGGNGLVAIAFRNDEGATEADRRVSQSNFCDFTVTIRVPVAG